MITLQAPKNLAEFRLEGQKIEFRGGLVKINERHLESFLAHGFTRHPTNSAEQSRENAAATPRRDTRVEQEQTP